MPISLVRAVLGRRVLSLLQAYAGRVSFHTPEIAFASVRAHLPEILLKRELSPEAVVDLLEHEILRRLPPLAAPVHPLIYADLEDAERRRLARRDESDWPFVALALRLNCPIWTEDQDFFGGGVATWTTDRPRSTWSPTDLDPLLAIPQCITIPPVTLIACPVM